MLDISQISQIHQSQIRSQCTVHPSFIVDTICFHHACRQNGNQIMCSYCSQSKPHAQHMDKQYEVHQTSPGFISINFTKDWHKFPQLIRERQKTADDFANLKTHFWLIVLFSYQLFKAIRQWAFVVLKVIVFSLYSLLILLLSLTQIYSLSNIASALPPFKTILLIWRYVRNVGNVHQSSFG